MKLYNCCIVFNNMIALPMKVLAEHKSDASQIYSEYLKTKDIIFQYDTIDIDEMEFLTRKGFASVNIDSINYTIKQ